MLHACVPVAHSSAAHLLQRLARHRRFEWNFQRLVQIHAVANSREWLTHLEHGRDGRSVLTA